MSNRQHNRLIISYDVADDRRRQRVARVLRSFGERVQYSVFIADVSASASVRIERHLREVIDSIEDSVLIFDLGPTSGSVTSRTRMLGRRRPLDETRIIVI